MQKIYWYFKDSFLFFLYDPLPRVHAVKKKITHLAVAKKTPRPLKQFGL
jgi:hypothetical protein